MMQSVNHTKKYINIKILLPHNYKIIINSIPKNIQITYNFKNTEKIMTKVMKPI